MWKLIMLVCATSACSQGPVTLEIPDLSGFSLVQAGQYYTRVRDCYACHQSDKPADGILSGQSYPRPGTMAYGPNLTPDPNTGIGGWGTDLIYRAMTEGVDNQATVLCPTMPRFKGMSLSEGQAIAAFLQSLPPVVRNDIPNSVCPPVKSADGGVTILGDLGNGDMADGGAQDSGPAGP